MLGWPRPSCSRLYCSVRLVDRDRREHGVAGAGEQAHAQLVVFDALDPENAGDAADVLDIQRPAGARFAEVAAGLVLSRRTRVVARRQRRGDLLRGRPAVVGSRGRSAGRLPNGRRRCANGHRRRDSRCGEPFGLERLDRTNEPLGHARLRSESRVAGVELERAHLSDGPPLQEIHTRSEPVAKLLEQIDRSRTAPSRGPGVQRGVERPQRPHDVRELVQGGDAEPKPLRPCVVSGRERRMFEQAVRWRRAAPDAERGLVPVEPRARQAQQLVDVE